MDDENPRLRYRSTDIEAATSAGGGGRLVLEGTIRFGSLVLWWTGRIWRAPGPPVSLRRRRGVAPSMIPGSPELYRRLSQPGALEPPAGSWLGSTRSRISDLPCRPLVGANLDLTYERTSPRDIDLQVEAEQVASRSAIDAYPTFTSRPSSHIQAR